MIFGREPVLILAVIRAVIVLVTVFGFDLTVEQNVAIYAFFEVLLSLVARQKVTPVAAPRPNL